MDIDCQPVLNGLAKHGGPGWLSHKDAWSGVRRSIMHEAGMANITAFRKIKAHRTEAAATAEGDYDGWWMNDKADSLARSAAEGCYEDAVAAVKRAQEHKELVKQMVLGGLRLAGQDWPNSKAMEKAARASSRAGPKKPHLFAWHSSLAVWVCRFCRTSTKSTATARRLAKRSN